MVQLKALFFVRVFQPLTITQLATKMQMRLASASALVNRLLRMGLVARAVDPHDRRRAHLTLAPAGQHLLADLDERASVRFRKLLGQMSPAGLTALEQALDELLRIAQAANTAPAHREQLNDRR
jgi:DNA-binding MarR family transcriptional regulator